jgi:hypothetical protein
MKKGKKSIRDEPPLRRGFWLVDSQYSEVHTLLLAGVFEVHERKVLTNRG